MKRYNLDLVRICAMQKPGDHVREGWPFRRARKGENGLDTKPSGRSTPDGFCTKRMLTENTTED